MERRELLVGIGAAVAAASVQLVRADDKGDEHSEHHHHGGPLRHSLIDSAGGCVKSGEICLDHCHQLLSSGDRSVGACARSVSDLIAVCGTLRTLAAHDSPYLAHYAKVAREFCEHCEHECRKHEDKHQQCKDCAEACAACAKECKAIEA